MSLSCGEVFLRKRKGNRRATMVGRRERQVSRRRENRVHRKEPVPAEQYGWERREKSSLFSGGGKEDGDLGGELENRPPPVLEREKRGESGGRLASTSMSDVEARKGERSFLYSFPVQESKGERWRDGLFSK